MKENSRKKTKLGKHHTWGDRLFLICVYVVIIAITLCCVYPLYYTIIASVSECKDLYAGKVMFLPSRFNLDAYTEILKNNTVWLGYANTIFYTVVGTLINLILTIPSAYALSRPRMWGRGILTWVFLFTMYFSGGMIPTYILYKNLGLINTRAIMLLCGGLSVYNVVVARTYFQNSIPEGLQEAARIDGANEFVIFAKIVLPLSSPIIAVITLYYAVGHWCSYFNALIYLTNTKLHPLQLVLRRILIMNEQALLALTDMDVTTEVLTAVLRQVELAHVMKFALVFISSIPMLIIYPFVQKHFVKGIMVGALKG